MLLSGGVPLLGIIRYSCLSKSGSEENDSQLFQLEMFDKNMLVCLGQAHYTLWLTDPEKGFTGSSERKN